MNEGEILEQLWELQKLDTDIIEKAKDIDEIKRNTAEMEEKINANKAEFAEKKNKLDGFRKQRAVIDVDIKTKEADIAKKQGQTSAVTTNEAYKALQDEMDMSQAEIGRFEEEILAIMEKEDETHSWLKEQEIELKKGEAEINVEKVKLQGVIDEKESLIAEDKKARDIEAAKTDKNWYNKYDRIFKNKGDSAVAQIITDDKGNGMCGGCKMSVRAQRVIEVKKRIAIHTCENCARLFYVPESGETK